MPLHDFSTSVRCVLRLVQAGQHAGVVAVGVGSARHGPGVVGVAGVVRSVWVSHAAQAGLVLDEAVQYVQAAAVQLDGSI